MGARFLASFIVIIVLINASLGTNDSDKTMVHSYEKLPGNFLERRAGENVGNESDLESSNRRNLDLEFKRSKMLIEDAVLVPTLFTAKEIKTIVNMHNDIRENVSPTASNMQLLEWDNDVAKIAQTWANNCTMLPGDPSDVSPLLVGKFGQNFYQGPHSEGEKAVLQWFEEAAEYDIHTLTCKKVCTNYTQLVWATSILLGCGIRKSCAPNQNIIVCNYYPKGNQAGTAPYKTGTSCSQCDVTTDICYKKSCMSEEKYKRIKAAGQAPEIQPPAICSLGISLLILMFR